MDRAELAIERTWNGEPAPAGEHVRIALERSEAVLRIEIEAPLHGDLPPISAAGSTEGLWNHEVVEVFLLGEGEAYLEIELGPHGHYLALALRGPRQVESRGLAISYEARCAEGCWRGRAAVPAAHLPAGLHAYNAYAIHGKAPKRRYLAAHPVPGPAPDFHRLECFGPLVWN